MRTDAAVNAGNALCTMAELLAEPDGMVGSAGDVSGARSLTPDAAARASQAFAEARGMYEAALRGSRPEGSGADREGEGRAEDEDDADVWSNLADCLVAHAQLLSEGPMPPERKAEVPGVCQAALQVARAYLGTDGYAFLMPGPLTHTLNAPTEQAYERSCTISDSANGDDLPGMLCNWGSGLLAIAQMTRPPQVKARMRPYATDSGSPSETREPVTVLPSLSGGSAGAGRGEAAAQRRLFPRRRPAPGPPRRRARGLGRGGAAGRGAAGGVAAARAGRGVRPSAGDRQGGRRGSGEKMSGINGCRHTC